MCKGESYDHVVTKEAKLATYMVLGIITGMLCIFYYIIIWVEADSTTNRKVKRK